jgi:competence protein ComEA
MSASIPTNGISSAPAAPAGSSAPSLPLPAVPDVKLPAAWPVAAQRATAGLLALAIVLIGWRAFTASRWSARPTTLEADGAAFRVDLNHADHARLLQLPGVGEALATRIEESRDQLGEFKAVDDLRRVSGFGPAMLERLRPFVYVQPLVDSDDDGQPTTPASKPAVPSGGNSSKPSAAVRSPGKKATTLAGPLDVNRATAEELQRLPGIGPAMSARIIAARETKPFAAVDDLRRVPGIGAKTLERLRPHVAVGTSQPSDRVAGGATE